MARFALFSNGVKVETLEELKENFNITDMLKNYRNKALHRWLMENRMTGELTQVEASTATEDDEIIDELVKIFGVSVENIEAQKRILEEGAKKSKDVLSEQEKELLTDIERIDFLKYMDVSSAPQNVIALLRQHALRGNAVAQLKLGYCYEYEKCVEKNLELAAEWYKKSAEQGHARAQNTLGYCFQYGNGVPKDEEQAVFWYRKSADQAFHHGLYNLGWCYINGVGIEKDVEKAVFLSRKSAEQGSCDAQCTLGWCYDTGTGVVQNLQEAIKWYKKSAEQGSSYAQYNLGNCYANGRGVEKDVEKSNEYYRMAAKQGHTNAKLNLISLTWDKDRIQHHGLSNICNERGRYHAGHWSSEDKMFIACCSKGIYSSSNGLTWTQELLDTGITSNYATHNLSRCIFSSTLENSGFNYNFYSLRSAEEIKKNKCPTSISVITDVIEHGDTNIFLLGRDEGIGITSYRKGSIVYGRCTDDPSTFVTKEVIYDDGYFPITGVVWGDKFLFWEKQYTAHGCRPTRNSRISIVDSNYNRIQTVLQLHEDDWIIFSPTPNLAVVFSPLASESYYTNDGITWTSQRPIVDITYVYGIYWALSRPSNDKQHVMASYDGITWKELGSISHFGGNFVIGNKKLFIWDYNVAFTANLDFFDER